MPAHHPARRAIHHDRRHHAYHRRAARRRVTKAHRRRVYRPRRVASRRSRIHRRHVYYRRVTYTRSRYHHVRYRHALYHRYVPWSPWRVSSYGDPSAGDRLLGGNPLVREAAIKAIGHWNGSIVVVNPNNGRILAMVNQKLAMTRGYIPCSTVKPMVALAGLKEGVVSLQTRLRGMSGGLVDMTQALARSDNRYFAQVGEMLGFARVKEYAEELGYGQKASLDIPDESPGVFPSGPPPTAIGGVGRLTSFGTGIDQTPLQMAALVSAIANGGTLYWLQYPRGSEETEPFEPKVRRVLTNLIPYIPEVRQGMAAAVLYGTARSAYNPNEDIFGKTGTCSEDGGRMGWFISFSQENEPQYVVVVELRGGRPMFGPHAAEIAGVLYRSLLPNSVEAARSRGVRLPSLIQQPGQ
ncbi:MAG: penicillin-binding transpeptidase domain-containing protein [Terriglobia bacterium]